MPAPGTWDGPPDPWKLERPDGSLFHGHYITVWKVQQDGSWRWVADIGTSQPEPPEAPEEVVIVPRRGRPPEGPAGVPDRMTENPQADRTRLLLADRRFGATCDQQGRIPAFQEVGSDEVRLFRGGRPPVTGLEPALAVLGEAEERCGARPRSGGVSRAADLGYTLGTVLWAQGSDRAGEPSGHYLRIWRRSSTGRWQVIVDVELPAG